MEIKILGTGCPKCKRLEELTRAAIEASGIESATITKVTDIGKIMAYSVMSTPALVINEKLLCSGRVPRQSEIEGWLKQYA